MSTRHQPLIVGLQGSPRNEGNTALLLEAALQGAADAGARVVKFQVNDLNVRPCQGCGACYETGRCVIRDDMDQVIAALEQMDAIVVASPVYFGGVTAQLKAVIDRCQPLWARKYVTKTPVADDNRRRDLLLLSVLGADKQAMVEGLRVNVKTFHDVLTLDGTYAELIFPKVEQAGEIGDHWEALGQAREAGARLAQAH
jgi:putative NADPH-quinone reductase